MLCERGPGPQDQRAPTYRLVSVRDPQTRRNHVGGTAGESMGAHKLRLGVLGRRPVNRTWSAVRFGAPHELPCGGHPNCHKPIGQRDVRWVGRIRPRVPALVRAARRGPSGGRRPEPLQHAPWTWAGPAAVSYTHLTLPTI